MRDYVVSLEKYGISRARVRELMWACRQYDECRQKAAAVRRGEPVGEDRGKGRNTAWHRPDPTGDAAMRLADDRYARRVAAIEASAKAADPALWSYIILNLCRGVPFTHLGAPCGRPYFTEAKRRFFVELDAKL